MSEPMSEAMSESISEPMSELISETGSPIVYVCITCRRAGEPEAEPRPGALLAAAVEQAAAGTQVEVRRNSMVRLGDALVQQQLTGHCHHGVEMR